MGREKPPRRKKGRRAERAPRSATTGAATPARKIEFPFTEGPVPEAFVDAVEDLRLFAEGFDLEVEDHQAEQLARYSQRLAEANQVMNLTRVDDPEGIATRHLADGLVHSVCLGERNRGRLLDLGTGPGLPSVPIAVLRPGWQVTALDATRKKIAFVQAVGAELGLDNLHPIAGRAEELGHDPAHRAKYSAVVARAVARLTVLLEYAIPFLEPDGFFFAAKGRRADEEVEDAERAFEELGCALVSRETYPTPDPESEFVMLVIQKLGRTPKQYPRHPSRIKSAPLDPITV